MEVVHTNSVGNDVELSVQCPICVADFEWSEKSLAEHIDTVSYYEFDIKTMEDALVKQDQQIEELQDFIEGYISTDDG